jgi:hypothetical protein
VAAIEMKWDFVPFHRSLKPNGIRLAAFYLNYILELPQSKNKKE